MKCIVCGTAHQAAVCPRCSFPDVQILGDGELAQAELMPAVYVYRARLLRDLQVSLLTYRWKVSDGVAVREQEQWMSLGTGETLYRGQRWLDQWFARVDGREQLAVTVRITCGQGTWDHTFTIANLPQPRLQQLGAAMDEQWNLRLLLRNDAQEQTASEPLCLWQSQP